MEQLKTPCVVETDIDILRQDYRNYSNECDAAITIALARIVNLQKSIEHSTGYDLIDHVDSRVKKFLSTYDKCRRKGCPNPTIEWIKANIGDVAGIRIITKYIDEINQVESYLRKIPGITITWRKDYVTNPKKNGYSSLHLGTQVEVFDPEYGTKLLPIEIQIRDLTMEVWAKLEHDIRYGRHKGSRPNPVVEEEFGPAASDLRQFAKRAMELRDYAKMLDTANKGKLFQQPPSSATSPVANAVQSKVAMTQPQSTVPMSTMPATPLSQAKAQTLG